MMGGVIVAFFAIVGAITIAAGIGLGVVKLLDLKDQWKRFRMHAEYDIKRHGERLNEMYSLLMATNKRVYDLEHPKKEDGA